MTNDVTLKFVNVSYTNKGTNYRYNVVLRTFDVVLRTIGVALILIGEQIKDKIIFFGDKGLLA